MAARRTSSSTTPCSARSSTTTCCRPNATAPRAVRDRARGAQRQRFRQGVDRASIAVPVVGRAWPIIGMPRATSAARSRRPSRPLGARRCDGAGEPPPPPSTRAVGAPGPGDRRAGRSGRAPQPGRGHGRAGRGDGRRGRARSPRSPPSTRSPSPHGPGLGDGCAVSLGIGRPRRRGRGGRRAGAPHRPSRRARRGPRSSRTRPRSAWVPDGWKSAAGMTAIQILRIVAAPADEALALGISSWDLALLDRVDEVS